MEEKLKRLKESMDRTVFQGDVFTEGHKRRIQKRLKQEKQNPWFHLSQWASRFFKPALSSAVCLFLIIGTFYIVNQKDLPLQKEVQYQATGSSDSNTGDTKSVNKTNEYPATLFSATSSHAESQFNRLPKNVQNYLKNHPDVFQKFKSDPTFNERIVEASRAVNHLDGKDVKWLMDHPKQFVYRIEPQYQRKNGQIIITDGKRYKRVYDHFYQNGLSKKEKSILAGLKKLGNSFYLKKDGSLVHVTKLSQIGEAKGWSTGANAAVLKTVSQKIKANADTRLKVIQKLLPITKDYEQIHRLLSGAESFYQDVKKSGITSEREYAGYYSLARELFIYESILNRPLPVKFQDSKNEELIKKLGKN